MARTKTSETKNLSNPNLFIILALISLLAVGVTALVAKSLIGGIVRDTKVIAATQKANKQLDDNLVSAPNLVSAYQVLGSTATMLADALPETADFPGLLVLLENISNDAGIKLKSVAPSIAVAVEDTDEAAVPESGPQAYDFTISFDGNYDALQKFLKDVEWSARPMRVTGIQLNGSSRALSGQIDLQTYYQAKAELPFGKEMIK